jgi:thioester reductase-like protein
MSVFLTGATGYLGSYAAAELLRQGERLHLLVRAKSEKDAEERLWGALQLHFGPGEFRDHLRTRVAIVRGDLTAPRFGLDESAYEALAASSRSVLHCAASLNRRSERACLDVNLRGTLETIGFAREAASRGGLRRFTFVSTVAVAGRRANEVVKEDDAIDWARGDYDPYARTKKFGEHMVRRILEDLSFVIVRPSVVLGDSKRPETTQFDMVRAFDFLSRLPLLPLRPADRIDVVPADWVGRALAALHRRERPAHDTYHLAAGIHSPAYRDITRTLAAERRGREPVYVPALERPFASAVRVLSRRGPHALRRGAALLDAFLPYLVWNTVFDNARVVGEVGSPPAAFPAYCGALLRFARAHHFRYPAAPFPAASGEWAK